VILSSHLLEQVQEVCDRVGIVYRGRMILEGRVDELTGIENQTELVLEGADQAVIQEIQELAKRRGIKVLSQGRPRTTLEGLFLRATGDDSGSRS
jgi:ABC-2 type transport system ATP-binding protein